MLYDELVYRKQVETYVARAHISKHQLFPHGAVYFVTKLFRCRDNNLGFRLEKLGVKMASK